MVRWKRFVLLALVLSEGVAVGCSSKAASPQQPQKLEMKVGDTTAPIKQVGRVGKPAPRESGFSTYNVPEYGVTFHYPRNFALDEGAPEGVSGIRSREELEGEEPGAELVATVVVPDDAYPNTTFAGGSLQFAVNRYLTATGCRESLIARLGDSNGPARFGDHSERGVCLDGGRCGRRGHGIFRARLCGFCERNVLRVFLARGRWVSNG